MKIWVEVVPEYYAEWSTPTVKVGRVFRKKPKVELLAANRIVEVDITIPMSFLRPRVVVDLY